MPTHIETLAPTLRLCRLALLAPLAVGCVITQGDAELSSTDELVWWEGYTIHPAHTVAAQCPSLFTPHTDIQFATFTSSTFNEGSTETPLYAWSGHAQIPTDCWWFYGDFLGASVRFLDVENNFILYEVDDYSCLVNARLLGMDHWEAGQACADSTPEVLYRVPHSYPS